MENYLIQIMAACMFVQFCVQYKSMHVLLNHEFVELVHTNNATVDTVVQSGADKSLPDVLLFGHT